MEPYLHMRTTFIVNSVNGIILLLCMLYVARARKTYPGFHYWTASTLFFCTGNLFIGLRGVLPDFLSIIAANMALISTFLMIPYGLALFAGKRHHAWPYLMVLLVTFSGLYFYLYVQPDIRARIIIISTLLSLTTLYSTYFFKKNVAPLLKGSNLILVVSLFIGGVWSLARAFYTATIEGRMESFLSASTMQVISVILLAGLFTFICFSLCILNFQRMERELAAADEEVKALKGILPMCAACKKIRDDRGYWRQVESYIERHSEATCSHGICPECMARLYPEVPEEEYTTNKNGLADQ